MKRLRGILRDYYIGAVAIGFLVYQAIAGILNAVMQPVLVYIQTRNAPPNSALASQSIFRWPQIIALLLDALLHLIVASLLILWVYRNPKKEAAPPAEPVDRA